MEGGEQGSEVDKGIVRVCSIDEGVDLERRGDSVWVMVLVNGSFNEEVKGREGEESEKKNLEGRGSKVERERERRARGMGNEK